MKQTVFPLLFLLIFQINSFAKLAPAQVATYDELIHEVRDTFVRGSERAQDAIERERVQTYWEVGKLIDEHILLHKERAEYGAQVMKRLSTDLKISDTELHYMVQFARAYPIDRPVGQLSWSHYQKLLSVNDPMQRDELVQKSIEKKWTRNELADEIKKIKSRDPKAVSEEPAQELVAPIKGKLNTYRIISTSSPEVEAEKTKPEDLRIDLGFSNYLEIPKKYRRQFKEGDIVQSKKSALKRLKNGSALDLFTYKAKVLEVVDGDTLWLWIDLGFGFATRQRVRLRGVDAPEVTTRDGQAAKEFVERELSSLRGSESGKAEAISNPQITITSTKDDHDQWGRYLVDVFYTPAQEDETSAGSTPAAKQEPPKNEEYVLDNELLKRGLATKI